MQKPTLDSTARFPALMRNQNPTRIQVKIETPVQFANWCNSQEVQRSFPESHHQKTINYGKKKPGEPWFRQVCVAKQSGRTGYSLLNGQRTIPLASRGSGLPWRPGTWHLGYKKHQKNISEMVDSAVPEKHCCWDPTLPSHSPVWIARHPVRESNSSCQVPHLIWVVIFCGDCTLACRLPEGIRRHAICAEAGYARQRAKQLPTRNTSTSTSAGTFFLSMQQRWRSWTDNVANIANKQVRVRCPCRLRD